MAHARRLGLICGILLTGWLYSVNYPGSNVSSGYIWIAPAIILGICIFLAARRVETPADPKALFTNVFKSSLAVTVIAVILFNIAAYIDFRWANPSKVPPFQAALFYSWILFAMGMVLSLAISALRMFTRSGR
jgi:hypothetical protein